mmetsp:Transcript_41870/g.133634  ORF Transcript_41870/g.133634 Transcript_41870/m.133634 type:complete len:206 (-) Transcript_41870:781-1398(-)
MPSSRTRLRMALEQAFLNPISMSRGAYFPSTPSSPSPACMASTTFVLHMSIAAERSCLVGCLDASLRSAPTSSWILSKSPGAGRTSVSSLLGLPILSAHSRMSLHIPEITSAPTPTASIICSSVRKSAKPSIMRMASSVPAIIRSRVDSAICSMVGLMRNLPSMRPTRTPATGLARGMSEMASAAPAAVMARGSGALMLSYDITH